MGSSQLTDIQKRTEAGLARDLGVSRQAIHALVKRGILSKDEKGLIDVEIAKIALEKHIRPSGKTSAAVISSTTPPPATLPTQTEETGETSYHIARTLREAAEAQIARLKLAQMRGELIQVQAVERIWGSALAAAREHLLQVRARLAPMLAAENRTFQIEQLLDLEHNKALNVLAGVDLK
jgi:hypothetical protein